MSNFKVIVALKAAKDQKLSSVRCAIQLEDKVKYTILPQAEGQFFDLNTINLANPITITFDSVNPQRRLGTLAIRLTSEVYEKDETELADIFILDYLGDKDQNERYTGRYYIIILNKGGIKQPEQADDQASEHHSVKREKNQSPTSAFLKSGNERNQERQKKDQHKKLLSETKYDPPKKKQYTSFKKDVSSNSGKKDKDKERESKSQSEIKDESSIQKGMEDDFKPSAFQKYANIKGSPQKTIGSLNAEIESLKNKQTDMKNKLLQNDANAEINDRFIEEVKSSEQKRRELQQIIRESVQDNILLKEEITKNISDMAREKYEAEQKIKQGAIEVAGQQKYEESLKLEISQKENKISKLLDKLVAMEEYAKICRILQDKHEEQNKVIRDNQEKFSSSLKQIQKQMEDLEKQKYNCEQDKNKAESTLQDLIINMQRLKEDNVVLKSLLDQTERKLQVAMGYEQSAKTLREQNASLKDDIEEYKSQIVQLNHLISQLQKDLDNVAKQQTVFDKTHQQKQAELNDVIKNQDQKLQDQASAMGNLQKDNLGLKEQNNQLIMKSKLADDLLKQLDQYKKDHATLLEDNTKLTSTIGDLTDQLQLSNQQIMELRQEVLRQSGMVSDQEAYANNLKKVMLEMQERGVVYTPAKGDETDQKLADFINQSSEAERWRQLFIREGEGVYQFGSKKVYVKCEQDKILIRSGGGYIGLEEFLHLFSQREMDNLQRADPLATLNKQKAIQKKMDQMRQVSSTKDTVSTLKKKGQD